MLLVIPRRNSLTIPKPIYIKRVKSEYGAVPIVNVSFKIRVRVRVRVSTRN